MKKIFLAIVLIAMTTVSLKLKAAPSLIVNNFTPIQYNIELYDAPYGTLMAGVFGVSATTGTHTFPLPPGVDASTVDAAAIFPHWSFPKLWIGSATPFGTYFSIIPPMTSPFNTTYTETGLSGNIIITLF